MTRLHPNRREFAAGVGAGIASAMLPRPMLAQGAAPKIVVVGGGFAGLTAARVAKRYDKGLDVTLVEANPTYTACPFSNDVIAGLRDIKEQQFGYGKVAGDGITLAQTNATGIDATARTVTLANGSTLNYDRLILAPGIELRFDALPGYDEAGVSAHAPCLEGRRADHAAAPPDRGDGGRRRRGDRVAAESLSLPARPL